LTEPREATVTNPIRLLLGPQRPTINLAAAVAEAGFEPRSLAVVSAAWQEAENDIDDVRAAMGLPLEDLELYARAEQAFAADGELEAAYRRRQDALKDQQRLYRLRLEQLALAARRLLSAEGDPAMLAAEQRHAIAQLRALDRHHLGRTEALHREFEQRFPASSWAPLLKHVVEIRAVLDAHDGLLITGGNIIVLLNRLRLFGLGELMASRHIVAWSAGAMALADRVVLYHDRMPQGLREPELLGSGLGLARKLVLLPDTMHRLDETDRLRAGLMSRRFAPHTCITLNSGASVELVDGRIRRAVDARRIGKTGRLTRPRAA